MLKIYDDEHLTIKDTASVLELDTSQCYRLFKDNQIPHGKDSEGKIFTRKADLIEFLNNKLPSGFGVIELQKDLLPQ